VADEVRRTASGHVDGRSTRGQREVGLTELIRQRILDEILSGQIAQDEIIQTAQLAKKYQTSRTPVREALVALERTGLITVLPHRGYMLRPITLAAAKDVFFMRMVIEGAAAERAAGRLRPAEAEQLWPDEQVTEPYTLSFDTACHAFHRAIVKAVGSPRLLDAVEQIFQDVGRLQCIVVDPPEPKMIHDEHVAVRDALVRQDGTAARRAMEEHIRSLQQHMIASLLG
jgi:GntR family transcriptional regulator, rspAB operon transcriptional repressor